MSSSTIRGCTVTPLNLRLFAPFGISGGAQPAASNVLVRVELEDGVTGYGEAAPLPPYNGETQADALAALASARTWIVGRDVYAWREIAAEFRTRTAAASGSAQCALEVALLDALTRAERMPLWKFFGGQSVELETDMTITTGSREDAAAAARDIRARGIRVIKVKIGGGDPELDVGRLHAIHQIAPDSPLVLDGNAGVSRAAAKQLVVALQARGIVPAVLEQWLPKDDLDGMRALHEETGWLVAADEAATNAADVRRIADARAAQIINIKLMKRGVVEALAVAAAARERGLELMIGGNVESILAMTASACFAAGLGGFRFADLDTPLFLAENPFLGGYALDGGQISVAHIPAGHGVVPRE